MQRREPRRRPPERVERHEQRAWARSLRHVDDRLGLTLGPRAEAVEGDGVIALDDAEDVGVVGVLAHRVEIGVAGHRRQEAEAALGRPAQRGDGGVGVPGPRLDAGEVVIGARRLGVVPAQ